MLKKIIVAVLGVAALAVGGTLVAATFQPDSYRISRERIIASSPEAIRPHLEDLSRWHAWSPWADRDPNQTLTYSDPPSGVDAWYTWEGNKDVGRGKMTITDIADAKIRYHLEFIEPFASKSNVEMQLEPVEGGTRVTWVMEGDNNFTSKVFGVFMDMDAMVGKDFERGLARLEEVAST